MLARAPRLGNGDEDEPISQRIHDALERMDSCREHAWGHLYGLRPTGGEVVRRGYFWAPEACHVPGHEGCTAWHAAYDLAERYAEPLGLLLPTGCRVLALYAPGFGPPATRDARKRLLRTRAGKALPGVATILYPEPHGRPGCALHVLIDAAADVEAVGKAWVLAWRRYAPLGSASWMQDLPADPFEALVELRCRAEQAVPLLAAGYREGRVRYASALLGRFGPDCMLRIEDAERAAAFRAGLVAIRDGEPLPGGLDPATARAWYAERGHHLYASAELKAEARRHAQTQETEKENCRLAAEDEDRATRLHDIQTAIVGPEVPQADQDASQSASPCASAGAGCGELAMCGAGRAPIADSPHAEPQDHAAVEPTGIPGDERGYWTAAVRDATQQIDAEEWRTMDDQARARLAAEIDSAAKERAGREAAWETDDGFPRDGWRPAWWDPSIEICRARSNEKRSAAWLRREFEAGHLEKLFDRDGEWIGYVEPRTA